eukprot:749806-Hanusia_phi.AAC.6
MEEAKGDSKERRETSQEESEVKEGRGERSEEDRGSIERAHVLIGRAEPEHSKPIGPGPPLPRTEQPHPPVSLMMSPG